MNTTEQAQDAVHEIHKALMPKDGTVMVVISHVVEVHVRPGTDVSQLPIKASNGVPVSYVESDPILFKI